MHKFFIFRLPLLAVLLFVFLGQTALYSGNPFVSPGKHPGFIENLGQLKKTDGTPAEEVLFYGNLPGVDIFFTKNAIVYDFIRIERSQEPGKSKSSFDLPVNRASLPIETKNHYRLDMQFDVAGVKPVGFSASGGLNNYYLGNRQEEWITGARRFNGIRYPDLYPGIDLLVYFHPDGKGLKYDFEVKPGADPALIQYRYVGANSCRINAEGQLDVRTPAGNLLEDAPFSYQFMNGSKKAVSSRFVQDGELLGFELNGYDSSQKTIIDPSVLVWSTYYGGNGSGGKEESLHLITDKNGDLVMVGRTNSTDFPVSTGASQTSNGGGSSDGFIVKFTTSGTRLWATYYGGSGEDNTRSCVADSNGNIYTIGTTASLNLPTKDLGSGAYFQANNTAVMLNPNNFTAFLGKFSTTGQMLWSTYFGGSTGENGINVWIDGSNSLLVTGSSASPDFPVSSGAFQTTYGGPQQGDVFGDAFLGKFSPSGALQWLTFIGGTLDDLGYGIATDSQNNIYLSAQSKGDFPTSPGAYQTTYGGGSQDAVIGKFSPSGARLWLSYYGGSGSEQGTGILFLNNFVYMAGYSSSNLPGPSAGVAQPVSGGGPGDGYISKWNPDNGANQLVWRTYTGGSGDDGIDEITRTPSGNIVCGGWTSSANYPVTPNAYQVTHGGGYDGHVSTFDENGKRICATYFGGSFQTDNVYGLATAPNGDIFLTGNTGSTTAQGFQITPGAFQPNKANNLDSYLARISEIPEAPQASFSANPNSSCTTPLTVNFTNTSVSNNTCFSNTTWEWSFPGGNPAGSTDQTPPAVTYSNFGTFRAKLTVTNASGTDTSSVAITLSPGAKVNAGEDQFLCSGDSVQLTASGAANYTWSPASGLSSTSGSTVMAKPSQTTQYIVTGSGGSCPSTSDTVLVSVSDSLPDPMIAGSSYCPGMPIPPLKVTNAGQNGVFWYTDAALSNQVGTGASYTPDGPGTWYVIMKQGSCISNVASFTLIEQSFETKVEANVENAFIPFDLIAQNKSINSVNCTWYLNDSLINYTAGTPYPIEKAGDYELKLICKNAAGCEGVDSLLFTVNDDKVELIIPNVFTPDKDPYNNLFSFQTSGIKTLTGRIYNRWGKEVYSWEGTKPENYWDGTIKGKNATDGVYFYVVEAIDIFDVKKSEKGTVTLIRGEQ